LARDPERHEGHSADLAEIEARFRAIFDAQFQFIGLLDIDGTVLEANATLLRFARLRRQDVLGHKLWELRWWAHAPRPDATERLREAIRRAASGEFVRYEEQVAGVGAETAWIDFSLRPMRDEASGQVRLLIPEGRDITERHALERRLAERAAALAASEARFRELYHRAPIPIHSIGPRGLLIDVSDEWVAFTGFPREAVLGRSFAEFLERDSARLYRERAAPELIRQVPAGETRSVEYRLIKRDGSVADVVLTARPERDPATGEFLRSLSVLSDVTARNRAEAALLQAQKLDALGSLTGGVAHDFNNLLMAVLASLRMLEKRLVPGDRRAEALLHGARQGAERGAALTRRLLAFARQQPLEPGPVDLRRLVAGLDELLRRSLGPAVRIECPIPADLWTLWADASQLELALVNLAVNARDAMQEGGTLRIAARNATVPADPAWPSSTAEQPALAPGAYVAIEISDSGTGMDATTLARATEPFFTTKGPGKGTGLGLSMVHGFVAQSGGVLRLRSRPGAGTTAELWLPRGVTDRAASGNFATDINAKGPAVGDSQSQAPLRILVVDDDSLVRMGTVAMVEELGHVVVAEAGSGAQALAVLRDAGSVDLLLTDQAMPGMTGQQLAEAARAMRPGLPVLLATGYAEQGAAGARNLPRLPKPYGLDDLATALSAFTAKGSP
jgi:PAS domain S-box-containing protein